MNTVEHGVMETIRGLQQHVERQQRHIENQLKTTDRLAPLGHSSRHAKGKTLGLRGHDSCGRSRTRWGAYTLDGWLCLPLLRGVLSALWLHMHFTSWSPATRAMILPTNQWNVLPGP